MSKPVPTMFSFVHPTHLRPEKKKVKHKLEILFVVVVFMYRSKSWTVATLARQLDAFDTWSLHVVLQIPYTTHVTNDTAGGTTSCSPVSSVIQASHLHFFNYVA